MIEPFKNSIDPLESVVTIQNQYMERLAAIIPVAGYSSRMGSFKPLLKLGSKTMIEQTVSCFLRAGISDVRVVVGYNADEIIQVVEPLGVKIIKNPSFDQGMYTSIQAGVRSLGKEKEAFFIMPADIPLVSISTIRNIQRAYRSSNKGIIYPTFKGQSGHPPLISSRYAKEIIGITYPNGLRGLLDQSLNDTFDLSVSDQAILLDMDTQEDYLRLVDYFKRQAIPGLEECRMFLREAQDGEKIWAHCHMVAGFAVYLVNLLNENNAGLDEDLVLAGALLHDIARSQPDHAKAGAQLLLTKGYPRVAEVVATHMDMDVEEDTPLSEAELIYLVDKMVMGDRIVSISHRLTKMLEKNRGNLEACMGAAKRLRIADLIKKKVEKILQSPLEAIPSFDFSGENNLNLEQIHKKGGWN